MDIALAIRSRRHTINRFRLAAHQRWREAELLNNNRQNAGAIYLYGYVAELLLKSAFLNLLPHISANTPVTLTLLRAEYTDAFNLGNAGSHANPNLHDLSDLFDAAVRKRRQIGRPYPPTLRNQITGWLATVSRQHVVEMRYFSLRPAPGVVQEVRDAVVALRSAYRDL